MNNEERDERIGELADEEYERRKDDLRDAEREYQAQLQAKLARVTQELEQAREELRKAREQEPVAWNCGGDITQNNEYAVWFRAFACKEVAPLYAAPKPAAPAVPEEWIKVLGRLLDVFERCEAGFTPHLEIRYAVRDEARALLQTTGAKP